MIKTLQKMGIEGTYFNIVKTIYDKSPVQFSDSSKSSYTTIKLGLFHGCKDSSIYANQSMKYTILTN